MVSFKLASSQKMRAKPNFPEIGHIIMIHAQHFQRVGSEMEGGSYMYCERLPPCRIMTTMIIMRWAGLPSQHPLIIFYIIRRFQTVRPGRSTFRQHQITPATSLSLEDRTRPENGFSLIRGFIQKNRKLHSPPKPGYQTHTRYRP